MRPPLVLLHGWGSSTRVWQPLQDALRGPAQLVLPLPGHEGALAAGARLEDWAAALLPCMPARFDLCGWSLGALLALALAHAAPERVRRLVLIGGTASFLNRPDWPFGLEGEVVDGFRGAFEADAAALMKRFCALQAVGERNRKSVLAQLQQSAAAPETCAAGLAAGLDALQLSDLRHLLPTIACPVRVLHGQGDALMPLAAATALADRLPDARLSVFDDCGHAPHLSRPADCAVLIDGFLDE